MGAEPNELTDRETRLDEVVAGYLQAVERDQAPSRENLLAQHPDLADELIEFFADRDQIEQWTRAVRENTSSGPTSLPGACPHCRGVLEPELLTPAVVCNGCGARFRLDSHEAVPAPASRWLGRFELLAAVGRGAFGTVYRARDCELDRVVAVKVPRARTLEDAEDLDRFLREARNAARLHHPGIVPVYDADQTDGVPYLVSAFVQGQTLAVLLSEQRPAPDWVAELLAKVADALHYAHGQGVIHRDVKPSNILLSADGTPYLMDFGLALRDGGEPTLTVDGQVLGTPTYMSPEQARGESHRVDGRSDVYSLGVILYQMLTGQPPFAGNARMIQHQVLHDEPRPPRGLNDRLPRDLETICLTAMAKAPARRYASAAEFAADLRRYLRREPIRARPVGRLERFGRWCRRNPTLATAGGLAATFLVAVTAVSVGWAVHAGQLAWAVQSALAGSERERLKTQEQLAERYLDSALIQCERGEIGLGLLWMARSLQTAPEGAEHLAGALRAGLASWQRQHFSLTGCQSVPGEVLAFGPDGETVWIADSEGDVSQRRIATGERVGPPLPHPGKVTAVAVSQDGSLVLTTAGQVARLWEAATGKPGPTFSPPGHLDRVALSLDGQTVLTADRPPTADSNHTTIRRWDARTGQQLDPTYHYEAAVSALALSPDGQTLLAARVTDGILSSWNVPTGAALGPLAMPRSGYRALAYSRDGRSLLTGSRDRTARLWDPRTGRPLGPSLYHVGLVNAVGFCRAGRTVLTADDRKTARTWAIAGGPSPARIFPHERPIRALSLSPDGQTVATASVATKVRLWSTGQGAGPWELSHESSISAVLFSPDGRTLLTADSVGSAWLWDVAARQVLQGPLRHGRQIRAMAFSADSRLIVTGSSDETAQVWDGATGLRRATLQHGRAVLAVAFNPTGTRVLTGGVDGTAQVWDAATGQPLGGRLPHADSIRAVAFSPNGERMLTAGMDGSARLWDAATSQPLGDFMIHGGAVWVALFSPDGQRVLTGSWDGTARLWDATTSRPLGPRLPHANKVWAVAFGPENGMVVTGSEDRQARLWRPPPPLAGTVERITLWAQVHTGMELDSDGGVRAFNASTWQQRKQRLEELDGPSIP